MYILDQNKQCSQTSTVCVTSVAMQTCLSVLVMKLGTYVSFAARCKRVDMSRIRPKSRNLRHGPIADIFQDIKTKKEEIQL